MKEKDFQTRFTRWLHYRYPGSGAFELKICHEKSLPFSAVAAHQIESLLLAKHVGIEYKIPDDTRGTKPFDCFRLHTPAFLAVMFYRKGVNGFYLIDIDDWQTQFESRTRESVIEDDLKRIGIYHEFK